MGYMRKLKDMRFRRKEREMKIFCGIVTFNPDIERLKENILAIQNQVDSIYIFDNYSDNRKGIQSLIEVVKDSKKKITCHFNKKNDGMACALNSLARAAMESHATHILLLDQDSVASPKMVKTLSKYVSDDVAIVCPLIVDRNVKKVKYAQKGCYEVKRPLTSGSLINLSAWSLVGGYDESFFVDWVDIEFCDNLRKHGFKMLRTDEVELLHELGNQTYAWSGPGRDYSGNRSARRGYYRQNYPAWRWRDRAKAQIKTIYKYRFTLIGFEEIGYFIKATLLRVLILEENKKQNILAVLQGVFSALKE